MKNTSPSFIFDYKEVGLQIANQCHWLFKDRLDMDVESSLVFDVPTDLGAFRRQNQTLKAFLNLMWSESNKVITFEFPAPYHGVFILRSSDSNNAKLRYWFPLLIEKPGDWLIKDDENRSKNILIRAVPGGFSEYYSLPLRPKPNKISKKFFVTELNESKIEVLTGNEFDREQAIFFDQTGNDLTQYTIYDEQDLAHKRLQTYNTYILEKFLYSIIREISSNKDIDFEELMSNGCTENDQMKDKIWDCIVQKKQVISSRLFPVHQLKKYGRLKLFNPLNNIDSVSLLTSFRKIRQQKSYNPITHQNHPSYRNTICPVETPESSEVGLTLHLSAGAMTDIWGNLYSSHGDRNFLGHAASLVPFYQHNDAVRVMMGAKNMRQAINIRDSRTPTILAGNEQKIVEINEPLIQAGLLPPRFSNFRLGKDLLVAYMPWYGYNFEDAIVANSDLRDKGGLTWDYIENFESYLKPGILIDTTDLNSRNGDLIFKGETIAHVILNGERIPFKHNYGVNGTLERIQFHSHENPSCGGKLEWSIKVSEPLQVGSKLMARYGNKGVISKFLDPKQMPKFPNDSNLPRELRGKPVDLLLNPHGVISRMNLGQLMETQYTMAHKLGFKLPKELGKRFVHTDPKQLSEFFVINPPFDKYGRIQLEFGDNKRTKSPVTVGYQYFTVLKQIPSKKAHARGGHTRFTPYNTVTGQPVEGRARRGGQRIGEMEFWALAAHQADNIMNELLTERSDPAFTDSQTQTTQAILDHLYFFGFKFDQKGNVQKVSDGELIEKCFKLDSADTRYAVDTAKFQCPNCDYMLMDGVVLESRKSAERSKNSNLNVSSLFDSLSITIEFQNDLIFRKSDVSIGKNIEFSSHVGPISFSLFRNKSSVVKATFYIRDNQIVAIRRIEKDVFVEDLFSLFIVCPIHTSKKVIGKDPHRKVKHIQGGLYDDDIFGKPSPNSYSTGWGYIDLIDPLPHPSDNNKTIQYLPVLPLKYRFCNPQAFLERGEENEFTAQYSEIYNLSKDETKRELLQKRVKDLYWGVYRKVFGGKNKGKYGLIRRHGLGRRVDFSGRLVLVPDPSLEWDEVGLPSSFCSVLFGKEASVYATDSGAQTYLEQCKSVSNQSTNETEVIATIAKYVSEKKLRVLVNRNPSLHKYNILSFRPKAHLISEGMVIKLNPIVFKGFGADADGDEMSIYALKDPESLIESTLLSPKHPDNLLSVSSGQPVLDFDQDWVLGNFLTNNHQKDSEGRNDLWKILRYDSNYESIVLEKMRSSLKEVTDDGVSFSYLELVELAQNNKKIKTLFEGSATETIDQINTMIENMINVDLEGCVLDEKNPGFYFAAMALSGARGTKQTRQILGARGHLSPGPMGFKKSQKNFVIKESLLEGMKPDSAYLSTYNARSSMIDKNMGTYSAGYLTRQLVLSMWPWEVTEGDCGEKSISKCQHLVNRRVCNNCYGFDVPNGYPAGLIAAQAIGERCTQLSMASFHTGQSVSPLEEVRSILNTRSIPQEQFIDKVTQISTLSTIQPQHIELLWVVLNSLGKTKIEKVFNKQEYTLSVTANNGGFGRLKRDVNEMENKSLFCVHPIQKLLLSSWRRD